MYIYDTNKGRNNQDNNLLSSVNIVSQSVYRLSGKYFVFRKYFVDISVVAVYRTQQIN